MKRLIIVVCCFVAMCFCANADSETPLPKHPGDKGRYYLLSVEQEGDFFITTHKRIGVRLPGDKPGDEVGFSKVKIDCRTNMFQDLGYGVGSESRIKMYPLHTVKWTSIVAGSSKSYLVNHVCSYY